MYGDLAAVHKLEKRWAEAFPNGESPYCIQANARVARRIHIHSDSPDSSLKRFAQRYKYDDIDQIALRDLGLRSFERSRSATHSRGVSGMAAGAGAGPDVSGVPADGQLVNNNTQPFQNITGSAAIAAAIPPHMAPQPAFAGTGNSNSNAPNMINSNDSIPVQGGGGNKRPYGTASQSPSRNVGPGGHGRPRGSIERSASPSRIGMNMGMGMGYPSAGPGPGPGPNERDNFVPNKRYRANSPRRGGDRDGNGNGSGGNMNRDRRHNKSGGRDTTPLGAQGPGPGHGGRNFSGAGGPPLPGPGAGPGMGAGAGGAPPYAYTPREGYDRSGVGRSLAWFVGELPPARSFDGTSIFSVLNKLRG